jgi:hypothetical protein
VASSSRRGLGVVAASVTSRAERIFASPATKVFGSSCPDATKTALILTHRGLLSASLSGTTRDRISGALVTASMGSWPAASHLFSSARSLSSVYSHSSSSGVRRSARADVGDIPRAERLPACGILSDVPTCSAMLLKEMLATYVECAMNSC